jgi:hypothetical protein
MDKEKQMGEGGNNITSIKVCKKGKAIPLTGRGGP